MAIEEISKVLWFIFFGFSGLFGILLIRKALGPDLARPQREYYLGMSAFILVHLIARYFYYLYDFHGQAQLNWDLGASIGLIGIVFLLYAIERNVFTRSKFFFTIITIIFIILIFILPPEFKSISQTIIVSIIGLFIPLIYLYVAYKGSGDIRKNSLIVAIGILIFLIGQTAHSSTFFDLGFIYFIISPVCMLVGGIIFLYGLLRPS